MQTNLESVQAPKPESRAKPVWESRIGAFSVSVWENRREIDGRTIQVRNVALTKRYRDRSGELRTATSYLMESELPKVIVILHEALRKMSGGDSKPEKEEAH